MVSEAKIAEAHRKADLFLERLTNGSADSLKPYLYDLVDLVLAESAELGQRKVENSDLRELIVGMREGFRHMDVRFEAIDKRLEQVDKRFEEILHYMDKRFEQVDKRFQQVDKRFEEILHYMDKRFEQVDKRFEEILHYMDKRFEEIFHYMDKRFEAVDARFNRLHNFLMWMLGLIATGFLGLYLKLFFT